MNKLDARYWQNKYQNNDTPWDIEGVSPALVYYFQQYTVPNQRILIPGAGRAHEAIWLHKAGYRDVTVCDLTEEAFGHLRAECPDFPASNMIVCDFFLLKGSYDVMIEQTFFCALDPVLRRDYVEKSAELLVEGGELAGLLFATPFTTEGPPFGGTRDEYLNLMSSRFDVLEMAITDKSIPPRLGNELFFRCRKQG